MLGRRGGRGSKHRPGWVVTVSHELRPECLQLPPTPSPLARPVCSTLDPSLVKKFLATATAEFDKPLPCHDGTDRGRDAAA
jgi:hypothetical protein